MISLNAITGIRTEDPMQLYITMGNEQFVALLDSGSTHNFIRGDVAHHVGLQFQPGPSAGVIVANGDRVACRGLARDVDIHIADETFTVECYPSPSTATTWSLGSRSSTHLGPSCGILMTYVWHFGAKDVASSGVASAQLVTTSSPHSASTPFAAMG